MFRICAILPMKSPISAYGDHAQLTRCRRAYASRHALFHEQRIANKRRAKKSCDNRLAAASPDKASFDWKMQSDPTQLSGQECNHGM